MESTNTLEVVWNRLSGVRSLVFEASSCVQNGGWNGRGQGTVVVEKIDSMTMLFREEGHWRPESGKELNFTNVYRWMLLEETQSLRLEHLRFGAQHPVYLFDLKQSDPVTWLSTEPHVCQEDLYSAVMTVEAEALVLNWTIKGPTKQESVRYSYS